MGYTGSKVTAPVSIYDVQRALGTNECDLGTLCKSSLVNFWAKYKPLSYNVLNTVGQWDSTNNKWSTSATWWKGNVSNGDRRICCGFSVPRYTTSPQNLFTNQTTDEWSIVPPTGGSASPYRLVDFAEYWHNAVCPFMIDMPGQIVRESSGQTTAKILTSTPTVSTDNLKLQDIIGNYYFGVVVKPEGGTLQWKTTDTANTGGALVLQGLSLSNVSYVDVVVMATDKKHTSFVTQDETATFFSMAAYKYTNPISARLPVVTIAQNKYVFSIDASGLRFNDASSNYRTISATRGNDNMLRGNGVLRAKPQSSSIYNISYVEVYAIQYSTGSEVGTRAIFASTDVQPNEISTADMSIGQQTGFVCPYFEPSDLPTLTDYTDFFTFTYIFHYTKLGNR